MTAGLTVAIGGFVNHRKPIQLLRQVAPQLQPAALVIFSASIDLDLALALWPTVTTLHCPFMG
ncbi:MAG TPA: hypothetical protein VEI97_04050, partial [bacterium]|nr:hypothetical protein [bacterium]